MPTKSHWFCKWFGHRFVQLAGLFNNMVCIRCGSGVRITGKRKSVNETA